LASTFSLFRGVICRATTRTTVTMATALTSCLSTKSASGGSRRRNRVLVLEVSNVYGSAVNRRVQLVSRSATKHGVTVLTKEIRTVRFPSCFARVFPVALRYTFAFLSAFLVRSQGTVVRVRPRTWRR